MEGFRKLRADEMECRVAQTTKEGKLLLLLYKDARVDQKLLDEKFGIFGWQRHHELIDGNLYCTVSVKNPETGEWVSKQDVGTKSKTEEEKGQASDSFKRACFNLGIGRELYSAPSIWVNKGDYNANDKGSTYDKFTVRSVSYDTDGNIDGLEVYNSKMKRVVFTYGKKGSNEVKPIPQMQEEPKAPEQEMTAEKAQAQGAYPSREVMLDCAKKHYPNGSKSLEALLKTFKVDSLDKASTAQLMVVWNKYGNK